MLKGGGSENVGAQYKLPDPALKAGRDLAGVRKVVIDTVLKAQGQGCAPGIIGVGIGGDRMTSYALSKEQFFRKLDDKNPDTELQKLEETLYSDLNKLSIGPMGMGGATTTLGVYIGWQHRHPATYYVSISYMCWAYRRKTLTLINDEVKAGWYNITWNSRDDNGNCVASGMYIYELKSKSFVKRGNMTLLR